MPQYFFRIRDEPYSNPPDLSIDVANRDEAWAEITKVCGDLLGDITKGLQQNAEWQIELLDASKNPQFRIRVVAESFR